MAASVPSNLGSQGRNLPKHQMSCARVMKMTVTRWMKEIRHPVHRNYSPVQMRVAFVYRRYGLMGNHVAYGKCKFQPERESLIDTAKIKYSKKLWGGEISIKTGITCSAATVVPLADSQTKEEEGWALRTTKKAKAFSEKQKKFLEERFMVGETTGRKLDPVTVATQMKIARDVDGQRKFSHEEVLSSTQIQSFFSRRAKCNNSEAQSVSDKDYKAAENE